MGKTEVGIEGIYRSHISKSKRGKVFFILFFIFLICYFYNCPDDLDLGRYYEDAASWPSGDKLLSILKFYFNSEINFIYQTTLVFFHRSFLGASFLTGIIVSTYYWFIIKNYYNNMYVGRNDLYMLGLLGFPPFIYVLAIARTACAVVIFYFGVESYLNNHHKRAYLIFIAALFTHVISGMFIALFFLSIFLIRLFSKRGVRSFNTLCFILPPAAWIVSSYLLPSLMSSSLLYVFFADFYRFETYLGDNYKSFSMSSYSLADSMMMGSYLLTGYVTLNITKYYSQKRCLFLIFFVGLCFVGGSNFILLERYLVASSLFFALYFSEILTSLGKGKIPISSNIRIILNVLCIICFFSFALTLFFARRDFF